MRIVINSCLMPVFSLNFGSVLDIWINILILILTIILLTRLYYNIFWRCLLIAAALIRRRSLYFMSFFNKIMFEHFLMLSWIFFKRSLIFFFLLSFLWRFLRWNLAFANFPGMCFVNFNLILFFKTLFSSLPLNSIIRINVLKIRWTIKGYSSSHC